MNQATTMYREASEASYRIAEQLQANKELMLTVAKGFIQKQPKFVVLVGRGSSDHAGLFVKYLIEVETGLPVMHAAPSVVSVFNAKLALNEAVVIAISQSGQSPDIVEYMSMARSQGAMTMALVNTSASPLGNAVEYQIPLYMAEERAVAATKSYLGSLSAMLHLISILTNDSDFKNGVAHIPQAMASAIDAEPQLLIRDLAKVNHCVVMGRGFGYAIGMEIALKLKEVCAIQAECFSSAEFLHGPVRIISDNFRVLNVAIHDESFAMHQSQSDSLAKRGAAITPLNCNETWIHKRVLPLAIMQRFYLDLEVIGREMGFNPDCPKGLSKITETY